MVPFRIGFSDLPAGILTRELPAFLAQRFPVQVVETNPDYLFYSVFGSEFLRHRESIRIFITAENVRPDFNLCDFAFGFDRLQFYDRYYRLPNYFFYKHFRVLRECGHSPTPSEAPALPERFCNFIYTNGNSDPFRDTFFRALSRYKFVHSPGQHLRNTPDTLPPAYAGDWCSPKVEYQRRFKFSIAFENSSTPGYTTEKIVHALAAGTVPIYWGNPEIGREFNTRRFVNCHEFESIDAIVARVAEIDRNDELWRTMVAEPVFPNGQVPPDLTDDRLLTHFENIFVPEKSRAYRRNFHVWGARYENERATAIATLRFISARDPLAITARSMFRVWKAAKTRGARHLSNS